jgi:hypothetical protein
MEFANITINLLTPFKTFNDKIHIIFGRAKASQ